MKHESTEADAILEYCQQPRSRHELADKFGDCQKQVQELLYDGELETTPDWQFYTL